MISSVMNTTLKMPLSICWIVCWSIVVSSLSEIEEILYVLSFVGCSCIKAFNGEMTTVVLFPQRTASRKKTRLLPHPHPAMSTQSWLCPMCLMTSIWFGCILRMPNFDNATSSIFLVATLVCCYKEKGLNIMWWETSTMVSVAPGGSTTEMRT